MNDIIRSDINGLNDRMARVERALQSVGAFDALDTADRALLDDHQGKLVELNARLAKEQAEWDAADGPGRARLAHERLVAKIDAQIDSEIARQKAEAQALWDAYEKLLDRLKAQREAVKAAPPTPRPVGPASLDHDLNEPAPETFQHPGDPPSDMERRA